jgi:hypothetical protein
MDFYGLRTLSKLLDQKFCLGGFLKTILPLLPTIREFERTELYF